VDDIGALAFARRVYRGLLGLLPGLPPESAHEAMTAARVEVAQLGPGGMQTWGAYQHYGDPNFRIAVPTQQAAPESKTPARKTPKKRGR
jgi:hypothetical protein